MAAFYPTLTLERLGRLRELEPRRSWFTVAEPLLVARAGDRRRRSSTAACAARRPTQARAAYDATVAAYRQTVLAAFQEVEDNLAALRILEEEAQVQDEAVQRGASNRCA